jgi:hypothetical protein
MVEKGRQNRIFSKLTFDFLVQWRIKRKELRVQKYKSFPKDTLIYAKDFSITPLKKTKQRYLRSPLKVIKEYRQIVYALDLMGRMRKLSKDNIKICGPRSLELFDQFPDYIKAILGEPLTEEIWNEIEITNAIPMSLFDIELEFESPGMTTRSMAKDVFPLQPLSEIPVENNAPTSYEEEDDDDFDIEEALNSNSYLDTLSYLHQNNELDDSQNLSSIQKIQRSRNSEGVLDNHDCPINEQQTVDIIPFNIQNPKLIPPRILDGINVSNIIPSRTRNSTRNKVTFNPTPSIRIFETDADRQGGGGER